MKRPTLSLPFMKKNKADKKPDSDYEEDKMESEDDSKEEEIPVCEDRKKEWKDDEKVKTALADIYSSVMSGFDDKADQNQMIERAWDIFNCQLNENQMYEGDSKAYLPITHDAIEARVTRFSNSVFPQTGRYTEVTSADGKVPYDIMALLDNYVERCKLRDDIIPALCRSADITGQFSLFISWHESCRYTIKRKQTPVLGNELADVVGGETVDDIEYQKVNNSRPDVDVLDARDLLVLPASINDIELADVVAVARRLSKGKIESMMETGEIDKEAGQKLLDNFSTEPASQQPDPDKKNLNAAGVKKDARGSKYALVYMIWTNLKLAGESRRCVAYMAGADMILSCKRNPYWSDRIPVISAPATKVNGSFWGKSKVATVEKMQYAANDAFNMGQDSIKYSLMPITVVDPEKFAKASSVVLTMGAIWYGDPSGMQIVEFPPQWEKALGVIRECTNNIMQSLNVNPSMLPGGQYRKPTKAEISQDQQVALESTADVVTILETAVLNELVRWFYELDYQFRTEEILVRQFGTTGEQAQMQKIPPIGVDTHYVFKWYGTEGNKSAQQIQQMISLLNVIKEIPPEMLNGRTIDAGPVIEQAANATFGPRVAPKVLIDRTHQLSVSPEQENIWMLEGFGAKVSPLDDDMAHLQSHAEAARISGDPSGEIRAHIQEHQQSMQSKQISQGQGQQGPRPGAQAQAPTGPQQPPGAVHPDQQDMSMPRDNNGE